ncbi:ATPase, AFG1 type [Ophiocordyceps camponoti-floridani]|uniref:ATPase, AFG1 type n=1 Tax=Ophiocordyceps camponoti-floridani TaxID=2030778 RepID=A0A8H4VD95_9HYPO|nr:ATPase, AFG1 type [Ophiocordyceps camponoti-floridani]
MTRIAPVLRRVAPSVMGRGGAVRCFGMGVGVGPLAEYDRRVENGVLRNDEHQRGIIESLEHLHNELRNYHRPPLVRPSLEQAKRLASPWAISTFFGRSSISPTADIPAGLPRGLYLHGDVGSGKTMLMDLFYDTLPAAVQTKTRIHFHNFMQDVHRRMHRFKVKVGGGIDALSFVAADIAEQAGVLCFDEFQCTDVADAMILRRLLESLMSHGVVLVTTSNRPPDELYKNGVQRESFLPAIALLKTRLHVINLDSPIDYRKIPRPPSGVYHTPLDAHAESHADKWFRFLGDPDGFEPRPETQRVWGREIYVPRVSGRCARFTFAELIGEPKSAADYLELVRCYDAFIVTGVPGMSRRERDLARRFITFIDAVYEGNAKLVLTTEKPLSELFVSRDELEADDDMRGTTASHQAASSAATATMEDVDRSAEQFKTSKLLFAGEEEAFAFARALSRLRQMESRETFVSLLVFTVYLSSFISFSTSIILLRLHI